MFKLKKDDSIKKYNKKTKRRKAKNKNSKNKKRKEKTIPKFIPILFYQLTGFLFCILLIFIICGGKNIIKIYLDLNEFINVYDTISNEYYGEIDTNDLVNNAIDSMLNEIGDNFTTYSDEESTKEFYENLNGTYEGIGCTVSMDENSNIYIVEVFEDSPAEKAGLKENDIILKIDDEDYTDKTSEDMSNYVKNNTNKKITLMIKREEETISIVIKREKVEIPVVTSEVIEENNEKIGYINIEIFSLTAKEQFENNLKKLEKQNIEGLIIDVRNNNGGYLSTATDIINLLLKKGDTIYQLESNDNKEVIKDTTKEKRTYPIAVLVNANSASASEILASAIKESYGGYVVGTNTYGKGTVQKTKNLKDGSMIKYTIQKWLTPNGNWINEVGVEPTDIVELDYKTEQDEQLEKAISLVLNKE